MPTPEGIQMSTSPSKAWMFACAALCTAIVGYGLQGDMDPPGDLAYQIGTYLPIALFLAGGLHLTFGKRETSKTGWLGFALVYASLVTAAVITTNRQKVEFRKAATDIQQTISAVQAASSAGVAPPSPSSLSATGTSEAAKASVVMKTIVNRGVANRREYFLELDAIGWGKILDGQRLRNDPTLVESKTMLQQAKDVARKYKSKTFQLLATARQDIENSDLSSSSKQSMLAGFDKSSSQATAIATDYWLLEEQMIAQTENVFNLLGAKRGAWDIQHDQITFQRQADLDLYNSYMAKVQSLVVRQEQLQSASIQKAHESLNKIAK